MIIDLINSDLFLLILLNLLRKLNCLSLFGPLRLGQGSESVGESDLRPGCRALGPSVARKFIPEVSVDELGKEIT